jgi:lipoate-protein ligase A
MHDPNFEGGVLHSYRYFSEGLIAALSILGLEVEVQPEVALNEAERSQPVCFELPSSYEITVKDKKLVGSAQLRRKGGVLQHGTMPLKGDIGRISLVLSFKDDDLRRQSQVKVRDRASPLDALLGHSVSWDQAAEAITQGFSRALGMNFETSQLTKKEFQRAEELLKVRYENQSWTGRL